MTPDHCAGKADTDDASTHVYLLWSLLVCGYAARLITWKAVRGCVNDQQNRAAVICVMRDTGFGHSRPKTWPCAIADPLARARFGPSSTKSQLRKTVALVAIVAARLFHRSAMHPRQHRAWAHAHTEQTPLRHLDHIPWYWGLLAKHRFIPLMRPRAGHGEAIVLKVAGTHPVIVATRDVSQHIELDADETAIFNSTGALVRITKDGGEGSGNCPAHDIVYFGFISSDSTSGGMCRRSRIFWGSVSPRTLSAGGSFAG